MRAALALLVVTLLLLAGCLGGGKPKGPAADAGSTSSPTSASPTATDSASTSSTTTTTSASATSTAPPANRAPVGAIAITVNGTSARFNLTGADADGHTLSWTLSFGDGNTSKGTKLPASVDHTYKVGNFTVRYDLTDGKATSSYAANLTIALAAPAQVFSGGWALDNTHCVDDERRVPAAVAFAEQGNKVTFQSTPVLAASIGRPFRANFTFGEDAYGVVTFTDAAGAYLARTASNAAGQGGTTVVGTVPDGAANVYFVACLTGNTTPSVRYAA